MILGQDVFTQIMLPEKIQGGPNEPSAFKSQLGWLIGGTVLTPTSSKVATNNTTLVHHSLNFLLQRFWETETVPERDPPLKVSDRIAETQFADTHQRLEDGSYQVRLPVVKDVSKLGNSLPMATKRLQAVEKRLDKDPDLKKQYSDFMDEYERLGHMKELPASALHEKLNFIPHHPVFKLDSLTTKLRVVYDGSATTDSGVSLNDVLLAGPTVQPELFDVLMKYRAKRVAISSDFVKMYRSFKVHPDDLYLQNVLWRSDPLQTVKVYQLQTITYGLKPSAFLATRCLLQLARDEQWRFPMAAQAIMENTDTVGVLSGADSVQGALQLREELEGITARLFEAE